MDLTQSIHSKDLFLINNWKNNFELYIIKYSHIKGLNNKLIPLKVLQLEWRVIKAPPVNPRDYISRTSKIGPREGR